MKNQEYDSDQESIIVVVPDDSPPVFADSGALARLRIAPNIQVTVFNRRPKNQYQLLERITDAHTVIGMRSSTRFSHSVFESSPKLKHLALWGTATGHISLDAARRNEIVVSHTPNSSTDSVAEHALALALALARRIPELDTRIRDGEWPLARVTQLKGKTLGVIGTGRIGVRMSQLARGIGMNVLMCSMNEHESNEGQEKQIDLYPNRFVTFETILKDSDVISVHARVDHSTINLFGAEEFAQMKPTSLFINTAHGQLVDERALGDALSNATIAGAALDVFAREPVQVGHIFSTLSNIILTPRSSGFTNESLNRGLNMVVDNIMAFLNGKPINRIT